MSTNVPNLKQIGGGHRKNGQKFVDLMWNDMLMLIKYKLKIHKVLLKVKTSHLWEYLKSYKSIKRTAQLKTFKLTLQQLFHCSNKKYQTMESGNKVIIK